MLMILYIVNTIKNTVVYNPLSTAFIAIFTLPKIT